MRDGSGRVEVKKIEHKPERVQAMLDAERKDLLSVVRARGISR